MSNRVPASMRTRPPLSDLIEGRLASPGGRGELVKLATRLIVAQSVPPIEPQRAKTATSPEP